MPRPVLRALAFAAAAALAGPVAPAMAGDPVIGVQNANEEMNAAIAAARASIGAQFWPRMEDPRGADLLLVKVAVPTPDGGREHIWVERARRLADGSMTGFLIMALAPMPMFVTFGVLTAVMIFFSLLVSLLVLPSLLMIITPSRKGEERELLIDEVTHGGEFEYEPHARETAVRTGGSG